jgi:parallel beta-helix repeat protein
MEHESKRVDRIGYMFLLFSLVLIFCTYGSVALAKTYHLYPEGKCPSEQECIFALWQISNIAPGDTVIFYGSVGAHKGPFGVQGWKGTAQSPITLRAASGQTPVIEGSIDIQQSEYVIVEGITVANSQYAGIMIRKGSNNITITQCTVKNNSLGIWISDGAGMENKINTNKVFSNGAHGIVADKVNCISGKETVISENMIYSNQVHGIEINANYYIIEKNEIFANGIGSPGTSGIHLWSSNAEEPTGDNNIIRYNICYGNKEPNGPDGNGIQLDMWCDYNQVYYNVCYNNDGAGIAVFDSAESAIFNNTLFNNGLNKNSSHLLKGEIFLATHSAETTDHVTNVTVKNNIIVSNRENILAIAVDTPTSDNSLSIGNNLLYNTKGGNLFVWGKVSGTDIKQWNELSGGANDISHNPVFASAVPSAILDFKLDQSSPCIDKGNTVGIATDIMGTKIFMGKAPDLGAIESAFTQSIIAAPKNFVLSKDLKTNYRSSHMN